MLHAAPAPGRSWRVVRRLELRYRGGRDLTHDRPAHVRAASALTRWRGAVAVVSDDASFVATIDLATGLCDPIALPAAADGRRQFDRGRGNKADKLDLEACFELDGALIALGSDSGLAVRRQAAVVDDRGPRLVPLPRLYAALHQPALGPGVLNLEGATCHGGRLALGNRGGDTTGGAATRDAIAWLALADVRALLTAPDAAAVPAIAWTALELGAIDGVPLRLTELEAWDDALAFAATAEATTTAYDDGAVAGSVIGSVGATAAWWAPVLDLDGQPLRAKLEGLVRVDDRWLASVDADDPERASDLLELRLDGA
ncbi:MAG: hypothetical protein IPL61_18430 [Myxococcales bacterium]|nr:hypothetical protein [Myxococcales bacterium]